MRERPIFSGRTQQVTGEVIRRFAGASLHERLAIIPIRDHLMRDAHWSAGSGRPHVIESLSPPPSLELIQVVIGKTDPW